MSADIIAKIQARTNHSKRIHRKRLPQLAGLSAPGLHQDEYDRLSVAYGLSFDAFDIGRIIKANDIPRDDDNDPKPPKPTTLYVDKDMV